MTLLEIYQKMLESPYYYVNTFMLINDEDFPDDDYFDEVINSIDNFTQQKFNSLINPNFIYAYKNYKDNPNILHNIAVQVIKKNNSFNTLIDNDIFWYLFDEYSKSYKTLKSIYWEYSIQQLEEKSITINDLSQITFQEKQFINLFHQSTKQNDKAIEFIINHINKLNKVEEPQKLVKTIDIDYMLPIISQPLNSKHMQQMAQKTRMYFKDKDKDKETEYYLFVPKTTIYKNKYSIWQPKNDVDFSVIDNHGTQYICGIDQDLNVFINTVVAISSINTLNNFVQVSDLKCYDNAKKDKNIPIDAKTILNNKKVEITKCPNTADIKPINGVLLNLMGLNDKSSDKTTNNKNFRKYKEMANDVGIEIKNKNDLLEFIYNCSTDLYQEQILEDLSLQKQRNLLQIKNAFDEFKKKNNLNKQYGIELTLSDKQLKNPANINLLKDNKFIIAKKKLIDDFVFSYLANQ